MRIKPVFLAAAVMGIVAASMIVAPSNALAADFGAINSSAYLKTYTITTANNTPVYTSTSFATRGTSSPASAYAATIYGTDEVYVMTLTPSYSYVSYPVGSGRRYGYIKTSVITSNNMTHATSTATAQVTTYTRASTASVYGYVSKGDSVTAVATSGSFVQVIYPTGSTYKLGWVTLTNYNAYIKPQPVITKVATKQENAVKIAQSYLGKNMSQMAGLGGWAWHNGAWCADFATYVLNKAGFAIPEISSVTTIYNDAIAGKYFTWVPKGNTPRPGDLALWNWYGSTDGPHDHVNIVISATDATHFVTIGGNQGSPATVSQRNSVPTANSTKGDYSYDELEGFARPIG